MPSALLVDLDDTLLDDRGSMAKAVLRFRAKHGFVPTESDEALITHWDEVGRELWRQLARGTVAFQEQRRLRLRRVFRLEKNDGEADALFDDYLTFYEESWSLLPGVDEFLAATAHLPRAIVTNGHRPQVQRKLQRCGLAGKFDWVVTPDDCGARKPDAKLFTHALSLLGIPASEALMVGDNLEADIEPAILLGMQTFHVNALKTGRCIRYAYGAA
jgi:putative hydrolase of the HAD superfamily